MRGRIDPNVPTRTESLADRVAGVMTDVQNLTPEERAALYTSVPYGPGAPMQSREINTPTPAGFGAPRRYQYPAGANLSPTPGVDKLVDFETLRRLADSEGVLRRCIEARKQEIAQLEWQIVPRD